MKKKMTSIIGLILVFALTLTGCGSGNKAQEGKRIRTVNYSEPGSLDPALAQGTHETWILNHLYTGLLTYDKDGKLTDGMASMPEVSEDGLTYTFKIKDDVKWSNGDPVTAKNFV